MMKMKSTASTSTSQNNANTHTTYQHNNSIFNTGGGGGGSRGGEMMRRVAPPLRSLLLTVGVAGLLLAAAVLLFALVITPSHFTSSSSFSSLSSSFSSSSSSSSTTNDSQPSAERANPSSSSSYTDAPPHSSAQVAGPAGRKDFATVVGGASKNIKRVDDVAASPGRMDYDLSSSTTTAAAVPKQDTPSTVAFATVRTTAQPDSVATKTTVTVRTVDKEEREEEEDRHHFLFSLFIGAARTLASVTTRNAIAMVERRTGSSASPFSSSSSSSSSLASASASSIAALKALLDPRDDAALVAAHLNHRYYQQQQQKQQPLALRDGRRKSTATGHDSNVSSKVVSKKVAVSVSPLPLPLVWLPHLAPQHIAALAFSPVVPTFWSHYHHRDGPKPPRASSHQPLLPPSPLQAQLCEVLYQPLCHYIDRKLQSESSLLSRQRGIGTRRRRRREILREAFVPGYISIDDNDDKYFLRAAANNIPDRNNHKNESGSDAASHSGGGRGDEEVAAEIAMTILSFPPPPPNPQRQEGSAKDGEGNEATGTTTTTSTTATSGSSVSNTDQSTSTRAAGPVTTRWVKLVAAGLGTSSTSSSSSPRPQDHHRHQQRPPCAAVSRLKVVPIKGVDSDTEEIDQHDAHRTFIARLRADADDGSSSRSEGATTIAAAVARRVVREGLLLGRCQTHLQQSEQQRRQSSNDANVDNLLPLSLLPLVTPAVEFSLWPFFEHVAWRASVIIQSEIHHHQRDEEEGQGEQQKGKQEEKEVGEAVPVGEKEQNPARRRRTSSGKRSKKRFSPALVQRARITLMRAEGRAIAAASDLFCDSICLYLRHRHDHHHNDHHNNHTCKKRNHHNTDNSGNASYSSSSNVLLSSSWRCGGYTLEKRVIGSDRDPTLRCRFFSTSSSLSAATGAAHHRHHHNNGHHNDDHNPSSSFPHSSTYSSSSNNGSKICYTNEGDVDAVDVEEADSAITAAAAPPLQMAFAWPTVLVPDYGSSGARVTTSSSGAPSTSASPPQHQQHAHDAAMNRIGNDFVIMGSKLVIRETGEGEGGDGKDDGRVAAVETSSTKDAATTQTSTPLLPFESSLNYYLRTSAASSRQQRRRRRRRRKSFPSSSTSTGSELAGDAAVPFSVAHRRDLRDAVLFAMIASNQMAPRRVVPALQTWLRHWDTVVFFEDAYDGRGVTTATTSSSETVSPTSTTLHSNDTISSSMSGEGETRRRPSSRGDGALWLPFRHVVNDDSVNQQKQRKVGKDDDHDDDDANRREKEVADRGDGGSNNKRARGIVSRRLASLLGRVDLHALGDVGPITAPPSGAKHTMNDDIQRQQQQAERARLARLLGDAVGVAVPTTTIGSGTTVNAPSVVLEVSTGHRLLLGDARPITRLEEVMTEEEDGGMNRNGNNKKAPKSGATTSSSSSASSCSSASALLIRHLQTLRRPQRNRDHDHDHHHAAKSATNNNNNNTRHISDENDREQSTSDLSFYGHITDLRTKHRTMTMKRRKQQKEGGNSMIPDICRDLVPPPSLIADNNDKRNDDDDSGARTSSTPIKKDPPEEVTPPLLLLRSRAPHAVVGFVRPLWLPEPNPTSASHGLGGAWKNFPMLFAMLADELQRHAALTMMTAATTTNPTTTTATIGTARISAAAAAGGGIMGGLRQYYVIIDDDTYYLHRNLLIYMTYFLPYTAATRAVGVSSRATTPPVLEKGGKQSTTSRATTSSAPPAAPRSMEAWMGMALARVLAQAQRAAPPPMLLGRLVYNRSNSEGSSSEPATTASNPNSSESTTPSTTTATTTATTTRKEADDGREQQQHGDEPTTATPSSSSSSSSSNQQQTEGEEQHDLVCENNILVNDWLHSLRVDGFGGDLGKNRKVTEDPRNYIHHSSSSNSTPLQSTRRPPPPRCYGHRAIHGGSGVWVNAPALLQLMMRSLLTMPSMAEEERGGGKVNPTNIASDSSSFSSSSFGNALVLNGLCQQPSVFGRSVYGDVWVGLCADMMIPKTPEPEKDDEEEGSKITTRRNRDTGLDTKKGNVYDNITNAQRRPKGSQHKKEEGEEEEQQWALRRLLEPVPMVPNPFLSELSPFAVLHIRRRHQAQHLLDVSNSRAAQIPSVWPYYTHNHYHHRDTHNRKRDRSIHSGSEHQHYSPQEEGDLPTSSRFQSGNASSTSLRNLQITAVATSAQLFATATTSATTARRLQQHLRPIRLEGRHHHAFKEVGGLFPVAFHQVREADDFWRLAALEYRYEGLLAAQQLQRNEENSNKNKNNTQMFQDVDEGSALRWVNNNNNNNNEEEQGNTRHHKGGGENNNAGAADGLLPSRSSNVSINAAADGLLPSSSSSSSSNVSIRINDPVAVDSDALVLLTGHLPLSWSRLATIPPTAARECGSYLYKHYLTVYRPQFQQLAKRQFLIQKKKREARWPQQQQQGGEGATGLSHLLQQLQSPQKDVPIEAELRSPPQAQPLTFPQWILLPHRRSSSSSSPLDIFSSGGRCGAAALEHLGEQLEIANALLNDS